MGWTVSLGVEHFLLELNLNGTQYQYHILMCLKLNNNIERNIMNICEEAYLIELRYFLFILFYFLVCCFWASQLQLDLVAARTS